MKKEEKFEPRMVYTTLMSGAFLCVSKTPEHKTSHTQPKIVNKFPNINYIV
jgi:hypothetical protein